MTQVLFENDFEVIEVTGLEVVHEEVESQRPERVGLSCKWDKERYSPAYLPRIQSRWSLVLVCLEIV